MGVVLDENAPFWAFLSLLSLFGNPQSHGVFFTALGQKAGLVLYYWVCKI